MLQTLSQFSASWYPCPSGNISRWPGYRQGDTASRIIFDLVNEQGSACQLIVRRGHNQNEIVYSDPSLPLRLCKRGFKDAAILAHGADGKGGAVPAGTSALSICLKIAVEAFIEQLRS